MKMLSSEEKKEITRIYDLTCKAFDKSLDRDVLKLQIEDLSDLDFNAIVQALHEYRKNPKNSFWPKANKIREIINPQFSPEAQANVIASKIREAISRHGWSNKNAAMELIGPIGWEIVERSGGWNYVCENHGLDLNPLTFHAQARDLAKSLIENNKTNTSSHLSLESGKSDVLKTLEFKIKEIPK